MKEKIKRILKSSKFGKILYPLFQKAYRIYSVPKKRRLLRKNGDVILKIIDKAFQGAGIEYFVDFGTLLGVIREGDFLKHDDDIDITICSPDINSHFVVDLLLKEGFSFIHSLEYKGKSRIVALDYKGTSVDFYFRELSDDGSVYWRYGAYFNPKENYPSQEWNNCIRISYPLTLQCKRWQFKDMKISVPTDPEEHLVFEYGEGWRVPDLNCRCALSKPIVYLDDYIKRVVDIEEYFNGK